MAETRETESYWCACNNKRDSSKRERQMVRFLAQHHSLVDQLKLASRTRGKWRRIRKYKIQCLGYKYDRSLHILELLNTLNIHNYKVINCAKHDNLHTTYRYVLQQCGLFRRGLRNLSSAQSCMHHVKCSSEWLANKLHRMFSKGGRESAQRTGYSLCTCWLKCHTGFESLSPTLNG